MRACDEDEGMPKYQVVRFQTMAPINAEKTTKSPCEPSGASMMSEPTVEATLVPRKAPSRFMRAAKISAARGVSARVDTDVAMAFAASWKPLVKSKTSAMAMTAMIAASITGQRSIRSRGRTYARPVRRPGPTRTP